MKVFTIYSQRKDKSALFLAKREKANNKLTISQRNSEEKEKFRDEISRRFAAKMVIMTWVLKMYSARFAGKLKQ